MRIIIAILAISLIACHEERERDRVGEDAGHVEDVYGGDGYVRPEPDENDECPEDHVTEWRPSGPVCSLICEREDDWCPPYHACVVVMRQCVYY